MKFAASGMLKRYVVGLLALLFVAIITFAAITRFEMSTLTAEPFTGSQKRANRYIERGQGVRIDWQRNNRLALLAALTPSVSFSNTMPECVGWKRMTEPYGLFTYSEDVKIARIFSSAACADISSKSLKEGLRDRHYDIRLAAIEAWALSVFAGSRAGSEHLTDVIDVLASDPIGWRYSLYSSSGRNTFLALQRMNGFDLLAERMSDEDRATLNLRRAELRLDSPHRIPRNDMDKFLSLSPWGGDIPWTAEKIAFLNNYFVGVDFSENPQVRSLANSYPPPFTLVNDCEKNKRFLEAALPAWGFSRYADILRLYTLSSCREDISDLSALKLGIEDERFFVWETALNVFSELSRRHARSEKSNEFLEAAYPVFASTEKQFLDPGSFFSLQDSFIADRNFYSFYVVYSSFTHMAWGRFFGDILFGLRPGDTIKILSLYFQMKRVYPDSYYGIDHDPQPGEAF